MIKSLWKIHNNNLMISLWKIIKKLIFKKILINFNKIKFFEIRNFKNSKKIFKISKEKNLICKICVNPKTKKKWQIFSHSSFTQLKITNSIFSKFTLICSNIFG